MSTAEQIIAEHVLAPYLSRIQCRCGETFASYETQAAHVVEALANAGTTIVQLPQRTDDRFVDGYEGCEMDGWEVQQGPHYVSVWEPGQVQIDYQGNPEEPVSPQYARDLAAALLAAARVAEGGAA